VKEYICDDRSNDREKENTPSKGFPFNKGFPPFELVLVPILPIQKESSFTPSYFSS